MFLSANAIASAIEGDGPALVDPFDPNLLKPASYLLRLGPSVRRWGPGTDPIVLWGESQHGPHVSEPEQCETITIEPRKVVLASTMERIAMPWDLVGLISTLSHLARCGVSVHCNSFLVSPGFGIEEPTPLTLELSVANNRSVVLQPGLPVCHLTFVRVESPQQHPQTALARSAYEGDEGPEGPKYAEEFGPLLGDPPDLS